jgi:anti-sigma factor RsiW
VTLRERRRARWRAVRPALLWTLGAFAVAVVIAVGAVASLVDAQQACYFQTAPCPSRDDPRLVWLAVAFFIVPLVWLLGLLLLAVRAMMRGAR